MNAPSLRTTAMAILIPILVGIGGFALGLLFTMNFILLHHPLDRTTSTKASLLGMYGKNSSNTVADKLNKIEIMKASMAQLKANAEKLKEEALRLAEPVDCQPEDHHADLDPGLLPTETMGRYLTTMGRISKENISNYLDLGVPVEELKPGHYSRESLPNRFLPNQGKEYSTRREARLAQNKPWFPPSMIEFKDESLGAANPAEEAFSNCQQLNVIYREMSNFIGQCTAIVPQYESYYIQKYLRVAEDEDDPSQEMVSSDPADRFPLRVVSRNHLLTGLKHQFVPPSSEKTKEAWDLISQFQDSLDDVLTDLRPILQRIAIQNTVVVMVANFGHAELLMNFVCAARARSIEISNVVVFTTDQETANIVTGLGLTAYFDERNFGGIPAEAARRYGDARFVAMMMAKVLCVIGPSILGYNLLFQDVDIVWYSNPLQSFFQNRTFRPMLDQFDVFFQDDGAHSVRYAPWSANSGFYYVKSNALTQHFLASIIGAANLIIQTDSHQQALIAVLSEHASLFGLRVKILSRDMDEFPGGYQYNMKSGKYMRALFNGTKHPIIFHMSWTNNKDNKLKFFQQMGEWYVQPSCIGKKREEMTNEVTECCSATPLFSCHYADKPSIRPCTGSHMIDHGKRKAFW
jgi:Nucleotide-diphospho-sugar transferase